MVWSKFISPFRRTGKNEKNYEDCFVDNQNVNEEYKAAHRTNSYINMLDKIEAQLRRRSLDRLTSSSSLPFHTHLSEYVLEPRQEILISMIENSKLHPLIVSYFQTSFEACNSCEILLRSVRQVRANYKIIQRVIKLTNGINDHRSYKDDQLLPVFDELASFSVLNNPLMTIKPAQFREIHNTHINLLRRLTAKFRSIRRKTKFARKCIFAAPGVVACSFGLVRRNKLKSQGLKKSLNERVGAELEIAAKGVFIMVNEFDTMSRLLQRLQNEIEHIKDIADLCVKNCKSEVLVEVVKEFRIHQTSFLEQLEELEEHIYLCFLTLNRSRTLVMQEIMVLQED